jgi:pSer/pThr/pTyr-binding forkhead associated (FHA) protein
MAKLVVKLNGEVIREQDVSGPISIGREAGDIVLKNPAVSARHARIAVEKNHYIVHDMKSTNGTFVNKTRIASQELHHGDVINIGKFEIEFINPEEKKNASDFFGSADVGGMTMMINTADLMKGQKEKEGEAAGRQKKSQGAQLFDTAKSAGSSGAVVSYKLEKETTLIGSGDNADIRVKGFSVANVAAVIRRDGSRYLIKFMGGMAKLKVNGEKVTAEKELKNKDRIEIGSGSFDFHE